MKLSRSKGPRRADGSPHMLHRFHVPMEIARQIHPDAEFECELTDEGVLFRVIQLPPSLSLPSPPPSWITEGKP